MQEFGAAPFFLADDRTTSSDEIRPERSNTDARRPKFPRSEGESTGLRRALTEELDRSLGQVNAKLRRLALGGSVSGSANANSVYIEVTRHLAESGVDDSSAEQTRQDLVAEVKAMGARSEKFEKLDLVPRFVSADYVRNIEGVPDANLPVLRSILRPYLRSLTARLDALESAQSLIQTLLDEANGFLTDKRLVFSHRSMRIELLNGEPLSAEQLSSGECHILLLLFSAVIARDNSRVFLIDEPELSLNVKWQRRVLTSLLSLTEGSGLQFIVATHSIELLSSYRERVVRLKPRKTDLELG